MEIISIKEVEYIAHRLAKIVLEFNEPIPDYSTRFANVLESCLVVPFQNFGGKPLYKGLIGSAAMLFYLMIKNHPFQNGNKRIAITTLLVFLYKNGKWLKTDVYEFYEFAMWVAQSPARMKTDMVKAIKQFIKKSIVKLKEKGTSLIKNEN